MNIMSTFGKDFKDATILSQYIDKPLINQYLEVYTSEVDLLAEQIHEVLIKRFLDYAEGAQLDVIGVILQQSRNLDVPKLWFGFQGNPLSNKMAAEATPTQGGIFKGEDVQETTKVPLLDTTYRKILETRALCMNTRIFSVNKLYQIVYTLLGRVPQTLNISTASKQVTINLAATEVTTEEVSILIAIRKWFIPNGVTLIVTT